MHMLLELKDPTCWAREIWINCMIDWRTTAFILNSTMISAYLQDRVWTTAKAMASPSSDPNGCCRFQYYDSIQGRTLHSLLRPPAGKTFAALCATTLSETQGIFKDYYFLIVDEKLMIRLKQNRPTAPTNISHKAGWVIRWLNILIFDVFTTLY
jgi:hypothetical protein